MTLFHDGICHDCDNCVMLLEKCIMGYYSILLWLRTEKPKQLDFTQFSLHIFFRSILEICLVRMFSIHWIEIYPVESVI